MAGTGKAQRNGTLIVLGALVIFLIGLNLSGSDFWQSIVINLGMYIILSVALNLSNGFTGVFSLGHIGFMALGAYISAILTLPLSQKALYLPHLPAWLGVTHFDLLVGAFPLGFLAATLIAGLVVTLVALIVGLVLMRLSGTFVSLATLGFLVIVRIVLINANDFTRGSRTFSNVTQYTDLWWVYAWLLITVYVVWRIKFSPYGRSMFAQREDGVAAQSVGIVIMRPRLLAFCVSAFFTAVVGALWAHYLTSFSPNAFYFDLAFSVITMMVVGGMGSVTGSIIGPILVTIISESMRRVEDATQLYGITQIVLAVLFILVIIFRPGGLLGDREINFAAIWTRLRPNRVEVEPKPQNVK
ncbi:MAG TPA: branched-chain amino acid ABC transporter permease [Phototrophicaceae bacterium]|nr:branched-chain amino acid ABC transporter permease [Phototrophicaceae bacterium]